MNYFTARDIRFYSDYHGDTIDPRNFNRVRFFDPENSNFENGTIYRVIDSELSENPPVLIRQKYKNGVLLEEEELLEFPIYWNAPDYIELYIQKCREKLGNWKYLYIPIPWWMYNPFAK